MPAAFHYVTVTEGGAHLIDAQMLYANGAGFCCGNTTTWTGYDQGFNDIRIARATSATPFYYFNMMRRLQQRATAWALRDLSNALCICPDNWAEKQYFRDVIAANGLYAFDYVNNCPDATANFKALGTWVFQTLN